VWRLRRIVSCKIRYGLQPHADTENGALGTQARGSVEFDNLDMRFLLHMRLPLPTKSEHPSHYVWIQAHGNEEQCESAD
jgi:hypothetical protein